MAYCTRCGAELPAGVRYCPGCGEGAPGASAPRAARTTLPRQGETPSEGVAILALLLNVFLLPGLGSLIAGRREGWYQIVLAVAGVILGAFFSLLMIVGAAPWTWGPGGPDPAFSALAIGILFVVIGALAGLTAWIWGLVTGISLLRESMRRPQPRADG